MKKLIFAICLLLGLVFLKLSLQAAPVSNAVYNELLRKHVTPGGKVNYRGFMKDSVQLNRYLKQLSDNPPTASWSKNDQLAYWINVYNAFTIKLITKHYPIKSIKDIGSKIKIPFVNTPWDIKFVRIGKEMYDLNKIEHGILREKWEEPRIHFAIVCASVSCPKLLNEAYEGSKIEQQLEAQARAFINDPTRNKITANAAQLSQIFSWFKGDFTKKGSLTEFINQYASVKISSKTKISNLNYNWNLNQ